MKLKLKYDFELEVGDDTYTGTFTDLTKKQVKEVDKLSPKKALKEAQKINAKIERLKAKIESAEKIEEYKKADGYYAKLDALEAKLEPLTDEVDTFDIEDIFQRRLELSINGVQKHDVLKVGEEYGYQRVFETIMKDIAKKSEGND